MPQGPHPTRTITRAAHAKLNLMLSVGAPVAPGQPRAGYHPICSWFACVELHDDVEVRPLAPGSASEHVIACAEDAVRATPIDWPLEKDLAVRAHRALEAALGRDLPARIEVRKRIPVGGGLGGGSADAGATLLALREAFGLDIDDAALAAIGATLGSDVAFFVDGEAPVARPALVSGLGEVVERVDRIEQSLVLVLAPFGCATGPVYKAFDEAYEQSQKRYELDRAVRGLSGPERGTGPREQMVRGRAERMLRAGRLEDELLFNDLAKPAFSVEPRLGQLVTALANGLRTGAHVTGSGSGVFLVPQPDRAHIEAAGTRCRVMAEKARRVGESVARGWEAGLEVTVMETRLV
jgi:4-diphosphocytidyl-2C-methyl-D-erythritol kinase